MKIVFKTEEGYYWTGYSFDNNIERAKRYSKFNPFLWAEKIKVETKFGCTLSKRNFIEMKTTLSNKIKTEL